MSEPRMNSALENGGYPSTPRVGEIYLGGRVGKPPVQIEFIGAQGEELFWHLDKRNYVKPGASEAELSNKKSRQIRGTLEDLMTRGAIGRYPVVGHIRLEDRLRLGEQSLRDVSVEISQIAKNRQVLSERRTNVAERVESYLSESIKDFTQDPAQMRHRQVGSKRLKRGFEYLVRIIGGNKSGVRVEAVRFEGRVAQTGDDGATSEVLVFNRAFPEPAYDAARSKQVPFPISKDLVAANPTEPGVTFWRPALLGAPA